MKQFLAFKGGALIYAQHKTFTGTETATAPEDLAEGAVGIYALSGTTDKLILVDGVADFLDVKRFIVARGLASGCMFSDEIERASLGINKAAAVSAVAQVSTVAFPTNLPAGTVVTVQVTDSSSPIIHEWTWRNYEYKTLAANEASNTIATAIATKINADSKAIVTANVGAITAKTAGKKFTVAVFDAPGATVTATTAPVRAEGSVVKLQDLQLECHGYQGGTRRGDGRLGDTQDYNLIDTSAGAHVVYGLTWTGTTLRTGVPVDALASRFKRLYMAIPTGATAITTLDAMLVGAAQEEVAAQAEESGV